MADTETKTAKQFDGVNKAVQEKLAEATKLFGEVFAEAGNSTGNFSPQGSNAVGMSDEQMQEVMENKAALQQQGHNILNWRAANESFLHQANLARQMGLPESTIAQLTPFGRPSANVVMVNAGQAEEQRINSEHLIRMQRDNEDRQREAQRKEVELQDAIKEKEKAIQDAKNEAEMQLQSVRDQADAKTQEALENAKKFQEQAARQAEEAINKAREAKLELQRKEDELQRKMNNMIKDFEEEQNRQREQQQQRHQPELSTGKSEAPTGQRQNDSPGMMSKLKDVAKKYTIPVVTGAAIAAGGSLAYDKFTQPNEPQPPVPEKERPIPSHEGPEIGVEVTSARYS